MLSPCSFTLHVVLGARPCFQWFPFTARSSSNGFHVLRVVWWSPAPRLFPLPRAARVGHYLQSSAAPAVVSQTTSCFTVAESCCFSVSLCSMCCASHGLCLSLALKRSGHPRTQLNSATWSSSESSYDPRCGAVFRERLSCGIPTSAECFEASLPLLPGSSGAHRTSEPSRSLRLLCLSCHGLVSVGACCCEAFRPLPRSSWSLRTPSLCTNLFCTLRCCLEHLYPFAKLFLSLEPKKSHMRQENVRAEKTNVQARQLQLYARTQLQGTYHKQREGSYGHFGPHPLWRAPGQLHVRRMRVIATGCGHTRQARAYSRLSKNSIHYGALSQHPPSDPLLTKEWRRTHGS